MKKVSIATALLLALTTWACQSKINAQPDQSTTVQGCLHSANGRYALADDLGNTFVLSGHADHLKPLVGHEVLIRGAKVQSKLEPGAPAMTSGNGLRNVIDVNEVRSVADTCTSGTSAHGNNQPKPNTEAH